MPSLSSRIGLSRPHREQVNVWVFQYFSPSYRGSQDPLSSCRRDDCRCPRHGPARTSRGRVAPWRSPSRCAPRHASRRPCNRCRECSWITAASLGVFGGFVGTAATHRSALHSMRTELGSNPRRPRGAVSTFTDKNSSTMARRVPKGALSKAAEGMGAPMKPSSPARAVS